MSNTSPAPTTQPAAKPHTSPDRFFAVDIRVGRVTDVEAFPEARRPAWKLTVDFGGEIGTLRTSAQVTDYSREELQDRLVVGTVNLGSKRIAGFKSEFLVLGAQDGDGTIHLLDPGTGVSPGDIIC
ncbi:tRNA-binding protein [Streptomyces ipomoeae]|jgi:tRNA-binding protein|uniref:tRNA-binding protein n=2 Tax=Streptomyces ipomoeae TaxID=103232 RepID=A0AAE9B319_9ACTN|nr:tRNA-binding protein [Streptomyces ipomoeae]EKX66898.1 putative CsaA protein [Streptomyces ipomoeae 91-03]MDX2700204.1 tRNA-binding protein [Streptomyces ipomoeae]MDX2823164.1 tRNA-binding protein [Streptomyces ipomoeae]MDX2841321.1 tRNA-binding protein [Streptomyces ipomoeae]MDX2880362.1 tRNA-binding protein [Streptomyces ipomoeae]